MKKTIEIVYQICTISNEALNASLFYKHIWKQSCVAIYLKIEISFSWNSLDLGQIVYKLLLLSFSTYLYNTLCDDNLKNIVVYNNTKLFTIIVLLFC